MPEVWATTSRQPGNPVTVAVIDTGIYAGGHPDLPPRSVNNARFLNSGADVAIGVDAADTPPSCEHHGTHVSGTILATTNNSQGVAGLLWTQNSARAVNHMSIRSLGCDGSGTFEDIIQGLYYAAGIPNRHGLSSNLPADVINLSLGGPGFCGASLEAAIQQAVAAGSVVVVAAGNNGNDAPQQPASCPGVTFTVGATNPDNRLVTFSSYGFSDLSAPGITVLSTYRDPDYSSLSGTSMATPHVSGAVAVLLQENPNLSVDQIRALVVNNAQSFGDSRMGAGILRVPAALSAAVATASVEPPPHSSSEPVATDGEVTSTALSPPPSPESVATPEKAVSPEPPTGQSPESVARPEAAIAGQPASIPSPEPAITPVPSSNSRDRVARPGEIDPAAEFVPGEILVLYRQPEHAAAVTTRILGQSAEIQVFSENPNMPVLLRLVGPEVATMGEGPLKQATLDRIQQLLQSPEVIYAEPNYILRAIEP